MNSINNLAESLASAIQSRVLLDNMELVALIKVNVRYFLPDIISERIERDEKDMQLLREAAVSAIGTKDYFLIGNKIGALRQKMKNDRSALDSAKKELVAASAPIKSLVVDVKNVELTAVVRLSFEDGGEKQSVVKVFKVKSIDDIPVIGDSIDLISMKNGYTIVKQPWMA